MTQMTDNLSNGTAAATPSDGTTAPGTVDPHLAEWDRATRSPAPISPDLLPVIEFAKGQMVEKVRAEVEKEVETAVNAITGQEDFKGVPKRIARGFLEAYALETPEFKAAYDQRKANPKGWQSALDDAGKSFAEDMKGFTSDRGKSVRSDVEAAKASVRGTSHSEPPPQKQKSAAELRNLSDAEFRRYKAQLAARG